MTEDKLSMYSLYMATLGNRPDLFPGYAPSTDAETDYEIPPEALEDEQFAAMMEEAEKYIGFPYVWAAQSATSFDCSGFVSWVVNNCGVGWNVGGSRLRVCTTSARQSAKRKPSPGIWCFSSTPMRGLGLPTSASMLARAGWFMRGPVGYIKFMDSYYSDNFVGFGRLPAAEAGKDTFGRKNTQDARRSRETEARIDNLTARYTAMVDKITELENLEIVGLVRAEHISIEQLAALIHGGDADA